MAAPDAPQASSPAWKLLNSGARLHARVYRLTGGRLGGRAPANISGHKVGAPIVLVEITGRKTGKKRTLPLIGLVDGKNVILVASKGGVDKHPVWYLNLKDNPECRVQVGRKRRKMIAREAGDGERADLWPRMVGVYGPYDHYQARTERKIPVIVLEPAG